MPLAEGSGLLKALTSTLLQPSNVAALSRGIPLSCSSGKPEVFVLAEVMIARSPAEDNLKHGASLSYLV